MKWSDISFHPTTTALRQFAAGWLVVFLAMGTHQYLARGHHQGGLVLALLAIAVGLVGLIRPLAIRWIYVAATVLAFPIGWVLSQIMLLVLFYGLITPVALLFRLRRRDPLRRAAEPGRTSHWVPKQTPQDMRSYFNQY